MWLIIRPSFILMLSIVYIAQYGTDLSNLVGGDSGNGLILMPGVAAAPVPPAKTLSDIFFTPRKTQNQNVVNIIKIGKRHYVSLPSKLNRPRAPPLIKIPLEQRELYFNVYENGVLELNLDADGKGLLNENFWAQPGSNRFRRETSDSDALSLTSIANDTAPVAESVPDPEIREKMPTNTTQHQQKDKESECNNGTVIDAKSESEMEPNNTSKNAIATDQSTKSPNSNNTQSRKSESKESVKRWTIAIVIIVVTVVFGCVLCRYFVFKKPTTHLDYSGAPLPVTAVLPSRSRGNYDRQIKKQQKAKYKLRQMDKRWDSLASDISGNIFAEVLHR